MEISIKRDGLILRGEVIKPEKERCPVAILFHGFMGCRGYSEDHHFYKLAQKLKAAGIASVRFDFNGHGKSDGDFTDMNIYNEINDAIKILDYAKALPYATEIYIVGHSQGGVVGGMLAGYYADIIKKLILLAPAATLKDDAKKGTCFGIAYDTNHIPQTLAIENGTQIVGGHYFRIVKTLPIYEVTANFKGPVLIIHGTEDEAVNPIAAKQYKEYIPDAELILVPGENHSLNAYAQNDIHDKIVKFLDL